MTAEWAIQHAGVFRASLDNALKKFGFAPSPAQLFLLAEAKTEAYDLEKKYAHADRLRKSLQPRARTGLNRSRTSIPDMAMGIPAVDPPQVPFGGPKKSRAAAGGASQCASGFAHHT